VPTWKSGGYVFRLYHSDHPPLHLHIFKDGRQIDRFDLEQAAFMDGTIGRDRGRVLQALRALKLISGGPHGGKKGT
jgi:hypothetical protein